MSWHHGWAPYVPVAQRLSQGKRKAQARLKKGEMLSPVTISGRAMAKTFWGKGWCDHFEQYSDFANRLPRGRTLARNGSIVDLRIATGEITAMVCGSDLYTTKVTIQKIQDSRWRNICSTCSGSVHSVIDLMRGKLSDAVIERLTDPATGMFPDGKEIKLSCSCPDGAWLCKHLAAVLYGAGNRLDTSPELLFVLRGVDQAHLVSQSLSADRVGEAVGLDQPSSISNDDLETIFGIDLSPGEPPPEKPPRSRKRTAKKKRTPRLKRQETAKVKTVQKKVARKKPAKKKTGKKTRAKKKKTAKKKTAKKKTAKKKTAKKKTAKKKTVKKKTVKKKTVKKKTVKKKTAKKKTAKKKTVKKKTVKKRRPVRPSTRNANEA